MSPASGQSARGFMRQRTLIQRNTLTSDGGGGYNDGWADLATVPCVKWNLSDTFLMTSARPEAIATRAVAVPLGTDVRIGDRLASVTDRKGTVVMNGPLKVNDIAERADHLRLLVERSV